MPMVYISDEEVEMLLKFPPVGPMWNPLRDALVEALCEEVVARAVALNVNDYDV